MVDLPQLKLDLFEFTESNITSISSIVFETSFQKVYSARGCTGPSIRRSSVRSWHYMKCILELGCVIQDFHCPCRTQWVFFPSITWITTEGHNVLHWTFHTLKNCNHTGIVWRLKTNLPSSCFLTFSSRRSNKGGALQEWEKIGEKWGGVSEKTKGVGIKRIACMQSIPNILPNFVPQRMESISVIWLVISPSIKIWHQKFQCPSCIIRHSEHSKINRIAESEEAFEGVFEFSVQETSKDLSQNGKLIVL